jgi:hypothetical protein
LIVTDKKLRAKRDRMFRYSPRWKEYFTQGYDFVVSSYSRRYDLGLYKDIDIMSHRHGRLAGAKSELSRPRASRVEAGRSLRAKSDVLSVQVR